MKKLFYILIMLFVMLMSGCGQTDGIVEVLQADCQADTVTAIQEELSEMSELHLETECDIGDEYMAGRLSVDGIYNDGEDVVCTGAENAAQVSLPIEIKLRGNSTKEVDKKAYTIRLKENLSLLGMTPGRKWALVSNPFDKSLLRPALGFTYAQVLGIEYTPDFRLCKVWLNDKYMGVYTVMEPIEAGEGRVDIDVDRGDFLLERNMGRYEDDVIYIDSSLGMRFEFNEPDEPDDLQIEKCREMLMAAEEAICSGEHRRYEKLIDVDSFVNFYIFHELIKDIDFGEYSTRYYFQDGIMHAGPPWDLDLTMGNVSAEKEEFKYASYNNVDGAGEAVCQVLNGTKSEGRGNSARGLWASTADYYYWLCRDPWFMELVQQRWSAVRVITQNLAVDNELGENLIDRYMVAYEDDLCSNYHDGSFMDRTGEICMADSTVEAGDDASWTVGQPAHVSAWQEPAAEYADNVEMLRLWLEKRMLYLDSQFGTFVYTPALAVQ